MLQYHSWHGKHKETELEAFDKTPSVRTVGWEVCAGQVLSWALGMRTETFLMHIFQ